MVTHGMIPYRPNPHTRDHEGAPGLTAARADQTSLRCSVAVVCDDEILLVHRSTNPQDWSDGDWLLPGGQPRAGETFIAAAHRAVIEQTGLDVLVGRCLLILELAPTSSDERIVELIFAAESTTAEGPHPQYAGRWPLFVPLSAAHQLRLLPPIAAFLPTVVRQQGSGAAYLGNLGRGAVPR